MRMRLLSILLLGLLAGLPALARQSDMPASALSLPGPSCSQLCEPAHGAVCEAACLMDAIWSATRLLPEDKQARLIPDLAALIQVLPEPALRQAWSQRIRGALMTAPVPSAVQAPDYALETARAAIVAHGWEGFIDRAVRSAPPLNAGRPEIMAAGLALAPDAAARTELRDLMFRLAGPSEPAGLQASRPGPEFFERAAFGHVLAEQMMRDCDGPLFEQAMALMPSPVSIRTRFWSARIHGNAAALAEVVRPGDGRPDTGFVRQAIEGYRVILELGYCPG